MGLLQPAVTTSAYLKMGLLGFQGSGKTKTAGKVAIGLIKHMQAKGIPGADKPAAMFDTETGSDWLIPDFKQAGIPFVVSKRRSFSDLLTVMKEAEEGASILIIDSITHPWRELCESWMKKKNRSFLSMDDWGYLKGEHGWAQFSDRFVNSKLHVIICGRAGYEFDDYKDDNGKRQIEKSGVKMKTESETGFEPSLLVLMERQQLLEGNKVARVWREAVVLKDRSGVLDGQTFEDPDFKQFLPHIDRIALGGPHVGVDSSSNSQHMLTLEKRDWNPVQREIVIGEIGDLLTIHMPGRTEAMLVKKTLTIRKHFNNASWPEIEKAMTLFDLRAGYDTMHRELEGKPSKYSATAPLPQTIIPLAADAPIDDISHILDAPAPKPPSLKEKILADIASNQTIMDCAVYGNAVAKMKDLTPEDKDEIGAALDLHRVKINGAVAA